MRTSLMALMTAMLSVQVCQAQQPLAAARDLRRDQAPSSITLTPEMWFYEQERVRYEDSKSAVRRKAEFRAVQREHRVAALKWYGMSNARPTCGMTPLDSTFSPSWVGGGADPFRWIGAGPPYVVEATRTY